MHPKLRNEYCGLGSYRAQWLQKFATGFYFTIFACLVIVVQGIYLGFIVGVITTIEKRLQVTSFKSGTLLSVYDIGHAITVLLVGHYGPWLHKPKWIGIGAWLSAAACFGLASPHFLFGPFDEGYYGRVATTGQNRMDHSHLCLAKAVNSTTSHVTLLPQIDVLESASFYANFSEHLPQGSSVIKALDSVNANWWAFNILLFFQFICGISSSPFTTLTYVYVDDNTPQKHSLFYFGLLTAMWGYGPALGFGLAAVCSDFFVTLSEPPLGVDASSPSWIGAWWLGFIILSFLYLISGIPFFFYPDKLKVKNLSIDINNAKDAVELDAFLAFRLSNAKPEDIPNKSGIKWVFAHLANIPRDILSLLKNSMFVCVTFSWIFGAYIIGGYSTFLPKYLETQFYQPTYTANVYGGLVAIIGAATAAALGGKVLSIFNPKPSSSFILVAVTCFVTFSNYLLLILITCSNKTIHGLPSEDLLVRNGANSSYSLCSSACSCDLNKFEPVCSGNLDYFSPCFAGCQSMNSTMSGITYSSCQCTTSTIAENGYCSTDCHSKMIVYLIGTFITGFVGTFFQVALFTTIIRSVPPTKKTMTYALANFFTSILGFMPSQVIFGRVIDTTCSTWSKSTHDFDSYCLIYDSSKFRTRYHMLSAAVAFMTTVFAVLGAYFARKFSFFK